MQHRLPLGGAQLDAVPQRQAWRLPPQRMASHAGRRTAYGDPRNTMGGTMGATHPQTFTLTARALAAVRAQTWTSAQLTILDMAIDAICDGYADEYPRFDAERFKTLAHYYRGRIHD